MSSEVSPSKPRIREFHPRDIHEVAFNMRQVDQWEIWHSSRRGAHEVLRDSVGQSFVVRTIERGGIPVAIFGLAPLPAGACPWMLGTDDLARCTGLLRECRVIVNDWAYRHTYLTNAVWSKNHVHIKWLRWMGFTFDGEDTRNGETFLHFHRSSHV